MLFPFKKTPSSSQEALPNTISTYTKLDHLSNFERAQGEQPRIDTL